MSDKRIFTTHVRSLARPKADGEFGKFRSRSFCVLERLGGIEERHITSPTIQAAVVIPVLSEIPSGWELAL